MQRLPSLSGQSSQFMVTVLSQEAPKLLAQILRGCTYIAADGEAPIEYQPIKNSGDGTSSLGMGSA